MTNVASHPPTQAPDFEGLFSLIVNHTQETFYCVCLFSALSTTTSTTTILPQNPIWARNEKQLGHFSCFLCPYKSPHIAFHLQPTMLAGLKKAMVQPGVEFIFLWVYFPCLFPIPFGCHGHQTAAVKWVRGEQGEPLDFEPKKVKFIMFLKGTTSVWHQGTIFKFLLLVKCATVSVMVDPSNLCSFCPLLESWWTL